jgi:hypothetical protein
VSFFFCSNHCTIPPPMLLPFPLPAPLIFACSRAVSRSGPCVCVCVCVCECTHTYTHTHRGTQQRERERHTHTHTHTYSIPYRLQGPLPSCPSPRPPTQLPPTLTTLLSIHALPNPPLSAHSLLYLPAPILSSLAQTRLGSKNIQNNNNKYEYR